MHHTITLEEGMTKLEEGIAKARMIFDGHPPKLLFTSEEYLGYYDCVYQLCVQYARHDYSKLVLERFKKVLEEIILVKVLPSLFDKDGALLLVQFLHMWTGYKAMSKFLRGIFSYLDKTVPLEHIAMCQFHDLVCKPFLEKVFSAAVSLIAQDRNGESVDRNLLQNISTVLMEIGQKQNPSYYGSFEALVLADAADHYSRLALDWLVCYSSMDYVLKVEQCWNEEKARVCHFLYPSSVEKLLQVLHFQLVDQTASKLDEKRRAENQDLTAYQAQGLLTKCANLSIQ